MKANEFYCVKCKKCVCVKDKNVSVTTLKNKRPCLRGNCEKCKTKLCKFIKMSDENKFRSKFRSHKRSKSRSNSRLRSKSRSKPRRRSKTN